MPLSFASLYCGCGGFDLGLIQAGYRCVGAFDIDPLAIQVHNSNLRSQASVCDLSSDSLDLEGLKGVDVLTAGSPCQGFSTIGNRNPDDPRNSLLVRGGHIAAAVKPKVYVAENVAGVIAGEHRRYWDALRSILRTAGYHTADVCCDAHQMGVPQRRRRMVMIAWRSGREITFALPRIDGGSVANVLHFRDGTPNHKPSKLPAGSQALLIAKHIRQGQKLSNVRGGPRAVHTWHIPEVFGKTSAEERRVLEALVKLRRQCRTRSFGDADPVTATIISRYVGHPVSDTLASLVCRGFVRKIDGSFDLTRTFNGKFRRLSLDAPSPTVDTRFGDPRYFLHPTDDRGITVREAARLQGFPDTFLFEGPERAQYRMIGNAVPPRMAHLIAQFVRTAILKD